MTVDGATGFRRLTFHASGLVYVFHYNRMLMSAADRNGNTITVNYPSYAIGTKASSITDTRGRVLSLAYTAAGKLSRLTDSTGRQWTYTYSTDAAGVAWLSYVVAPDGSRTDYGYAAGSGLLEVVNDGSNNEIKLGYDSSGRVTSMLERDAAGSPTGRLTTLRYLTNSAGPYTEVTDPRGNTTSYFYDLNEMRVTRAVDALGRSRQATYTPNFDVATAVDAMGVGGSPGNTTRFGYDADNNPTSAQAPTGALSTAEYRASTSCPGGGVNIYRPKCTASADGNSSAISYDNTGNATSTVNTTAGGGAETVSYGYTGCGGRPGQVCSVTDGRGKITRYSYNSLGERTRIDPPAPLGAVTFSYDALSRLASVTDGTGSTTAYSYDGQDRIIQTRYAGSTSCTSTDISAGRCITADFRADGLPANTVDQSGMTSFGYDPYGKETSRITPNVGQTWLDYDDGGNVIAAREPAGVTSYSYDQANQLISLAEPGGSCTASPTVACTRFGYDNNGVRTSTTYPTATPTVVSVSADASSRISQIRAVTGQTVQADLAYTYSRQQGGVAVDGALVRSRTGTENPASTNPATISYGYDSLARLTSAVETTSGTTTGSWTYGYDSAGNRTTASLTGTPGAPTTSFGYNDANQLTSRDGNPAGFGYDGNGAETAAVGATTRSNQTWNAKRQLTLITTGTTSTAMTYGGEGNKTRLSAGPTSYRNTALGVTAQTTNTTTSSFVRTPDGTLIALRTAAGSFYYLTDNQGSVLGLVDSSGTRVNSYRYDPYGISRSTTEAVTNPYQYTGGQLDPATGMYKLGIRYYDPTLGRFTQPDPTGQDAHYAYARNNPVNYIDPSGACSFFDCIEKVDAVAGVVVAGGASLSLIGIGVAACGTLIGCVPGIVLIGSGVSGLYGTYEYGNAVAEFL